MGGLDMLLDFLAAGGTISSKCSTTSSTGCSVCVSWCKSAGSISSSWTCSFGSKTRGESSDDNLETSGDILHCAISRGTASMICFKEIPASCINGESKGRGLCD